MLDFFIFSQLKWFRETFYYELLYSFGSYELLFCLGYLFSKDKIYENIVKKLENKVSLKYFGLLGIILVIIIRSFARSLVGKIILFDIFMTDQILVPSYIFFSTLYLISTRMLKRIFLMLGEYSTAIWLIHCYFILNYYQSLIYFPRYSILILIWSFLIFIFVSKIILKLKELKKQMNTELSIIVTVYNVGQYLEECLDSIYAVKNIKKEVILVNDGSIDGSLEILKRYEEILI